MEKEPKNFSFLGKFREIKPSTIFVGAFMGDLAGVIILGPGGVIPGFLLGGLFGFALEWQNPTNEAPRG